MGLVVVAAPLVLALAAVLVAVTVALAGVLPALEPGLPILALVVGPLAVASPCRCGCRLGRKKEGYGRFTNLGIGMVGAVIGGFLFELLNINLGLEEVKVTLQDLISALIGSAIFLGVLWGIRKKWGKKNGGIE